MLTIPYNLLLIFYGRVDFDLEMTFHIPLSISDPPLEMVNFGVNFPMMIN